MPRFCDIVMKGGITSGIVYPAAVFEIAKDFVFKNVGGTSAGAIAAALTAAAERRRARDGSTAGFERVAAIPGYLASEHRLYRLFAPNAATRSLYRTVVSLFGRPRFAPAWLAKWCGLVWAYPVASVLGALAGLLLLAAVLRAPHSGILFAVDLVAASIAIVAGITIGIVAALVRDVLTEVPKNAYGLVTGVDDADRSSQAALCTWLTRELELTAGLEPDEIPLTFGMLWDAKRDAEAPALQAKPAEPDVNLEMITTNVTWGRPYQFPLDLTLFFDPQELLRFFPDHVVEWMKRRPRAPRNAKERGLFETWARGGKLPLPLPADLPVIVATRMSLAFPVLLSAVPLYGADFSQPAPDGGVPELECCWFSDGGISSNFPIALFDSPLPRWPTFAINLAPFHPAHPRSSDEVANVHMPQDNSGGSYPSFSRFGALPGFLSAVFGAMQNWNDNTLTRLPGYRDRIVTVYLAEDEGGLNLDMPQDVLERLRLRGAAAGALIAGRFKTPSLLPSGAGTMDWENHRWLRFRSTMGALRGHLSTFTRSFRDPQQPDRPYHDLIVATDGTPSHRYPIVSGRRADVDGVAQRIAELGDELGELDVLDDQLPKPTPQMVLRGRLES